MQMLDLDFLHVAILALTAHLLHSFLLDLVQFSERMLFIFSLFTFLYFMRGQVDITDSVDAQRNRVRLKLLEQVVYKRFLSLLLCLKRIGLECVEVSFTSTGYYDL